jgi:pimeloyl-ACP methyl ester carboxylesterase
MGAAHISNKLLKKLDINGLSGRMLLLPKPTKNAKQMLLVYGINSSLERVYPLATTLNKQVAVTVPDLPGLGGMDGMHRIGMGSSLDDMTDYIATIIKLHFPKQKFILAGLDTGFAIVNNLLARYPEIASRVEFVVSLGGINDWRELQMPTARLRAHRILSKVVTRPLTSSAAHGMATLLRPRLRHVTPDLKTYLQVRHSLLHLKRPSNRFNQKVHYFPGTDTIAVDQTTVMKHLKELYKHVHVVTDFALLCDRSQVDVTKIRSRASLTWLKR